MLRRVFGLLVMSAFMVSSGFYTLRYLNFPMWIFVPFSLTPLFLALYLIFNSENPQRTIPHLKRSILSIWCFGFLVQLISFFWITKPILYFGGTSAIIAYSLYVLIALLSSTYFILLFSPFLLFLVSKRKFSSKKIYLLMVALSVTFLEILIPRFFDWGFGGLLSSNLIWSQMESLFGMNTGSFFIFYSSMLLAHILRPRPNCQSQTQNFSRTRVDIPSIGILCCLFVFVTGFGLLRYHALKEKLDSSPRFRVAFIQPNFTFPELASLPLPSRDSQKKSFNTMIFMSKEVVEKSLSQDGKKPDLVVWPESTGPDFLLFEPYQIELFKQASAQLGVPFLLQGIEMNPREVKEHGFAKSRVWSSSFILDASGIRPHFFQKWIPMPFGEELPFENIFPFLGKWYRSVFANASKIERGSSYQSLPVADGVFVTPLICFDSIDQKLSFLSAAKGGASFFVNQANFVWMVDSNAGLELSLLDQMRAIENGRSVVVASNTGPSLVFDPLGRLLMPPSALLTQGVYFVDIPLYTDKTVFQQVYIWPLVLLGLFSFVFLCAPWLTYLYFNFVKLFRYGNKHHPK